MIWNNTEKDTYRLGALTDADIEHVEKHFDIKLPEAYIALLREQNGGYMSPNCLPVTFQNDWADDHIPLDFLFGVKPEEGVMESEYLLEEWEVPAKNLLIISGDGHFFVALDYRQKNKEPEIVYIDTEEARILNICDSFQEMIDSLYEETFSESEQAELDTEIKQMMLQREQDFKEGLVLLESSRSEDVLQGMDTIKHLPGFVTLEDVFLEKLLGFLQHADIRVKRRATEYLADYVIYGLLEDTATIQQVLALGGKEKDQEIQKYVEKIQYSIQ